MEEDDQSEPKFNSASPSKKININNELPLMNIENIEFTGRLTIHITIIGKKKCGKSALIKSYLNKSFESEKQDTTLDIFGKKILVMGHEVSLVISEVSQDKADYLLSKEIINVSHIVFICYSLEDDIEKMNDISKQNSNNYSFNNKDELYNFSLSTSSILNYSENKDITSNKESILNSSSEHNYKIIFSDIKKTEFYDNTEYNEYYENFYN